MQCFYFLPVYIVTKMLTPETYKKEEGFFFPEKYNKERVFSLILLNEMCPSWLVPHTAKKQGREYERYENNYIWEVIFL